MTPKDTVLSGYKAFADGDMESLGSKFHQNCVITVNGDHKLSGEYNGFDNWLSNFLSKIPEVFPNFNLEIVSVTAENERVHVFVHLTADNLDAYAVHMFVVEDDLQTEFRIFDDSQKIAAALEG
ncbi:MAG: hypothetical protein CL569_03205 [Alphaproteobacteria bacterium]|nr:hypothetical protein [Alphaproteobacteria bacterium]